MKVKSNLVGNGAMRVTIPKRIRAELGWTPGDMMDIVRKGEMSVVITRCKA